MGCRTAVTARQPEGASETQAAPSRRFRMLSMGEHLSRPSTCRRNPDQKPRGFRDIQGFSTQLSRGLPRRTPGAFETQRGGLPARLPGLPNRVEGLPRPVSGAFGTLPGASETRTTTGASETQSPTNLSLSVCCSHKRRAVPRACAREIDFDLMDQIRDGGPTDYDRD